MRCITYRHQGVNKVSFPTEKSIENSICDILSEYSESFARGDLNLSLSLRDDLAIDSLTFVSIVLRLEDAFKVDLIEKGFQLHTMKTVGDLVELGRSLTQEAL
jgi:acyl carrier protein